MKIYFSIQLGLADIPERGESEQGKVEPQQSRMFALPRRSADQLKNAFLISGPEWPVLQELPVSLQVFQGLDSQG